MNRKCKVSALHSGPPRNAALMSRMILAVASTTMSVGASASVASITAASTGSTEQPAATYSPPDMTSIGVAELKRYYKWREKMDWLLAPIHTRADLNRYLKQHATTGSPLDALSPDARERFLASIEFGRYGAFAPNYSDLQYLSTKQVYKILALLGEQNEAIVFTGGRIRPASPQAAPPSKHLSCIEQRFYRFQKIQIPRPEETHAQRAGRLAQSYDRWFASVQTSASVRELNSHDLRLLFRAATLAAAYTHNRKRAADARMDFSEMERRHFAGPPDYHQMYGALVDTRQFAAARKFYVEHPGAHLTPFPEYRDGAGNTGKSTPTILVINTWKDELVRRRVALDKPAQVLILTDPHCHFCADFDRTLRSRPKLRTVLEGHTVWVTPPGSELEFATLQRWNKANPQMPLAIMYSLDGWPMVKTLAVPQFFFLQRGKLVAYENGWGKDAMVRFESGLKAIGLWQ